MQTIRGERERYKTQMPIINNTSPTSRPDIKHSLIQEGSPFYNCTHPAAKFSRIPRFTIYFPLPCLDFFGASFAIFRRDNQYSCLLFKLSCNNHQSQGHTFADCQQKYSVIVTVSWLGRGGPCLVPQLFDGEGSGNYQEIEALVWSPVRYLLTNKRWEQPRIDRWEPG